MSWVRTAAAGLALAAGVWAQGAGAAEVKNVTAKYAWPWGVGISYEVSGTIPADAPLFVKALDRTKNVTYCSATNMLSGDTGTAAGKHQIVWDLDTQGVSIQSTNVTFTVAYEWPLYCVVDLSAGANASSYPVTYLHEPPSGGFNTDAYKTTKLVLRRVPAGTFTMGSPRWESGRDSDEDPHNVTLTKAFYIGLFEVTQKQWTLVMGSNPSNFSGDKRPVEMVSYNSIRGGDASSFVGRLQARTGLAFDLPTEAQWEYACRAGTTTAYSYGGSANGDYMWYYDNSSSQTRDVGTKKANPWGLYDMHGNVWEWCLDSYTSSLGTAAVTDPKGASSGSKRVVRGGSWGCYVVAICRSASRDDRTPSGTDGNLGFRLSRSLSAE